MLHNKLQLIAKSYMSLMNKPPERKIRIVRQIERIAKEAGLSVDAVHNYFENISAILRDTGSDWIKDFPPRTATDNKTYNLIKESINNSHTQINIDTPPANEILKLLEELASRNTTISQKQIMELFDISLEYLDALLNTAISFYPTSGRELIKKAISPPHFFTDEGFFSTCKSHLTDLNDNILKNQFRDAAIKFALVETRPEQALFRKRVYLNCKGRCVISGCDVPEALDAAHLTGRNWRSGENAKEDGILLRKDIHALYDSMLIKIDDQGRVAVSSDALNSYEELNGKIADLPQ